MEESDDLVGLWLVLGPVAMAGIAGCVVVGLATFVPGPLRLPEWLDAVFGLAAFPVLLATVVTGRRMQRRRRRILDEIESVAPAAWPTALFVLVGFGPGSNSKALWTPDTAATWVAGRSGGPATPTQATSRDASQPTV